MAQVSAGALDSALRRAVDAQGKVAQAAQDEAARVKAQRDGQDQDETEAETGTDEAEA